MWKKLCEGDIEKYTQGLQQLYSMGNNVENYRCIFMKKDDPVVYMFTVFDWIDAKIPPDTINLFQIWQSAT